MIEETNENKSDTVNLMISKVSLSDVYAFRELKVKLGMSSPQLFKELLRFYNLPKP